MPVLMCTVTTATIMTLTWVIHLLTAGDNSAFLIVICFFGKRREGYLPCTFVFMGMTCFIKLNTAQYRCGINCPSCKICSWWHVKSMARSGPDTIKHWLPLSNHKPVFPVVALLSAEWISSGLPSAASLWSELFNFHNSTLRATKTTHLTFK